MSNQPAGISLKAYLKPGPSVVLVSVVQQGAVRYLQEDGSSEIFLVPVSTTEEVSLIDLWIQNIFMCSPEVTGQLVEALSFQPIFGWSSQLFVERMTRKSLDIPIWVKTLNVLRSSRGSRSALFSISLMGVVFMAPTMALSATFGLW